MHVLARSTANWSYRRVSSAAILFRRRPRHTPSPVRSRASGSTSCAGPTPSVSTRSRMAAFGRPLPCCSRCAPRATRSRAGLRRPPSMCAISSNRIIVLRSYTAEKSLIHTVHEVAALHSLSANHQRCRTYCGGHWVKRGGFDSENGKRWELRTKNIEDGPILGREDDRSRIGATSLDATRQTDLSVTDMTV
jgi:hypothetical protein